jgi:hypothetical protein
MAFFATKLHCVCANIFIGLLRLVRSVQHVLPQQLRQQLRSSSVVISTVCLAREPSDTTVRCFQHIILATVLLGNQILQLDNLPKCVNVVSEEFWQFRSRQQLFCYPAVFRILLFGDGFCA